MRLRFLARVWRSFVFHSQADDAVFVDKSFDRFTAVSYLVLVCWGVSAMIGHAPAVQAVSGETIAFWWAAAIALVSIAACIGASFERWSLEMYALGSLIGMIGLYPLSVLALVLLHMRDASSSSIIATAYLLIPQIWRLWFTVRRIRRVGAKHG